MARSCKKPQEKLSFRAYAKRRGVSHTAVARAVAEGRLTAGTDATTGRRWIDPQVADSEWEKTTDEGKAKGGKAYRAKRQSGNLETEKVETKKWVSTPPQVSTPPPAGEPDQAVDPNDPRSYAASNARHKFFQARLTELEFRRRDGELVDGAEVAKGAFEAARIVREAILAIPDRLAAELASESDTNRVHATLTRELRQAIEEITGNA